MLPRLDSILLGGQTVGIVAHGMKHVESLQALEAGIYVGSYVAEGMTYVKTGTRRVGKHVEHVIFRPRRVYFGTIGIIVAPILLPARFYISVIVVHIYVFVLCCSVI